MLRFVENNYKERQPTIGAFFLTKRITVDNITCKLLIWDTAGQPNFQKLSFPYYEKAAAVIFTFDVTQPATLVRLSNLMETVKANLNQNTNVVFCIVACKCDLPAAPGLMEEARRLTQINHTLFFETSAKQNVNVRETFCEIASSVLELQRQDENVPVTVPVLTTSATDAAERPKQLASAVPQSSKADTIVEDSPTIRNNTNMCQGGLMSVCGSEDKNCRIM